jgi:hypothetical protein
VARKSSNGKTLEDILEKDVPQKYYASKMIIEKRKVLIIKVLSVNLA